MYLLIFGWWWKISFPGTEKSARKPLMTSLHFTTLTGRWCFLPKFLLHPTCAGKIDNNNLNIQYYLNTIRVSSLYRLFSNADAPQNLQMFNYCQLIYFFWSRQQSICCALCYLFFLACCRSMQAYFEQWLSLMLKWDSISRGGGRGEGRPHCFKVLETMLSVKV